MSTFLTMDVTSVLSVLGDKTTKTGDIIKIPLSGYGPSSGFPGHVWVMQSTHPTLKFYEEFFTEILIPDLKRKLAMVLPREAGVTEESVQFVDGEREQIDSLESDSIKQQFKDLMIAVVKHAAGGSAICQSNDAGNMHKTAKTLAKYDSLDKEEDGMLSMRLTSIVDKCLDDYDKTIQARMVDDVEVAEESKDDVEEEDEDHKSGKEGAARVSEKKKEKKKTKKKKKKKKKTWEKSSCRPRLVMMVKKMPAILAVSFTPHIINGGWEKVGLVGDDLLLSTFKPEVQANAFQCQRFDVCRTSAFLGSGRQV